MSWPNVLNGDKRLNLTHAGRTGASHICVVAEERRPESVRFRSTRPEAQKVTGAAKKPYMHGRVAHAHTKREAKCRYKKDGHGEGDCAYAGLFFLLHRNDRIGAQ